VKVLALFDAYLDELSIGKGRHLLQGGLCTFLETIKSTDYVLLTVS